MKNIVVETLTSNLLKYNKIRSYLEKQSTSKYRIVYYHYIGDKTPDYYFNGKGISVDQFKAQIEYFQSHFRIITISQALERLSEDRSLNGCLTISIDDGFKNNYDTVAPILDYYGLSASLFIITDFIDNADLMWRNKIVTIENCISQQYIQSEMMKLSEKYDIYLKQSGKPVSLMEWSFKEWDMELKDEYASVLWESLSLEPLEKFLDEHKPYMTLREIKELHDRGFDICSHSCSHPIFDRLDWKSFEREIVKSVRKINEITGKKKIPFSYPFGRRASQEFEARFVKKYKNKVGAILGIRNRNQNCHNPYMWERDLQEDSVVLSQFRFLLLPIMRNRFGSG